MQNRKRKHRTPQKHAGITRSILLSTAIILAFLIIHPISFLRSVSSSHADNAVANTAFEAEESSETAESEETLIELEMMIDTVLESTDGDWSVYVKNLSTGNAIAINDHMSCSASLIKLFVAGCYASAVENGEIEETEALDEDLAYMISLSDNDAWVALETAIGYGSYRTGYQSVTQWAQEKGYTSTGRLITEDGTWDPDCGNNYTSVSDVGKILESIYNQTFVSAEASEEILELMLNQYWQEKIPAGLSDDVNVANKTGELDTVQNDSAIVYGPVTDYILVVMSQDITDTQYAIDTIVSLSSLVYNYLEA